MPRFILPAAALLVCLTLAACSKENPTEKPVAQNTVSPCVQTKIDAYRKEVGQGPLVTGPMLDEWEAQCKGGSTTTAQSTPTPDEIGVAMSKCTGVFLGSLEVATIMNLPQKSIDGYQSGVEGSSNVAKKLIGQDRWLQIAKAEQNLTTQAIKSGKPIQEISEWLVQKVKGCNEYFKKNEATIMQLVEQK